MSGATHDRVFADVDKSGVAPGLIEYLERVGQRPDLRRADELSFELLAPRPGDHVLEAGCGIGDDAAALARLVGPDGRVTAVDLSEQMVTTARQRHAGVANLDVATGDVRALDAADATYDGARAERVVQHLDDPAAAARELVRVVRPGGRIVLVDTDWATLAIGGVDEALTRRVTEHFLGGMITPHAGRNLRAYLANAGVREVGVRAVALSDDNLTAAREVLPTLNPEIPAEAGIVPLDVRAEWFAALDAAQQAGRFTSCVTIFVAGGAKP